jgi:ATP-dependent DNA helicase DinG
LIKARLERLREEGQDPFFAYQVPEAVISLKQGLGRLLRTQTDRGLLAVLDARLVNRGYGKMFLRSLPNSPLTRDKRRVAEFFGRL